MTNKAITHYFYHLKGEVP